MRNKVGKHKIIVYYHGTTCPIWLVENRNFLRKS